MTHSDCIIYRGTKGRRKQGGAFLRKLWQSVYGEIEPGMCLCHSCDVPLCINLWHVWPGTKKQNAEDAARKGRIRTGPNPIRYTVKKRYARQPRPYGAAARGTTGGISDAELYRNWENEK